MSDQIRDDPDYESWVEKINRIFTRREKRKMFDIPVTDRDAQNAVRAMGTNDVIAPYTTKRQ